MMHPRPSIRELMKLSSGRQVGYCSLRKADVADAVTYILQLEARVKALESDRAQMREALAELDAELQLSTTGAMD